MSQRRKVGDRVWVRSGASFGASAGEWATVQFEDLIDPKTGESISEDPGYWDYCLFRSKCGDDNCREWANLETDDGRFFYHVSECQMHDGPPP